MKMKKNQFERELAGLILATVKNPQAKGRERRMSSIGHFNRTVFSNEEQLMKVRLTMLVRLMVNLGMELTEPEFMHLWSELGNRIFDVAEQWGDMFNDSHKRQKHDRR